jgi:hypothetical protein
MRGIPSDGDRGGSTANVAVVILKAERDRGRRLRNYDRTSVLTGFSPVRVIRVHWLTFYAYHRQTGCLLQFHFAAIRIVSSSLAVGTLKTNQAVRILDLLCLLYLAPSPESIAYSRVRVFRSNYARDLSPDL